MLEDGIEATSQKQEGSDGREGQPLQGTVASLCLFQDQRPKLGKSGFGLVWQFLLWVCLLLFDFFPLT